MSNETWRPVPGYEGIYSVSDLGRIRSDARTMRHSRKADARVVVKEKIRVLSPNSNGYLSFAACGNGNQRTLLVHCCVLEAFQGPRPEGMQARHLDGIKTNNKRGNLIWGTPIENKTDQFIHGTVARGSSQWKSKLTADVVTELRTSDESNATLARRFGVHRSTVRLARSGRTWRHV